MILSLPDILTPEELTEVRQLCHDGDFIDGKFSAGGAAKAVKNNLQMSPASERFKTIETLIFQAARRSPRFQAMAFPVKLHSLRVSRYTPGMHYGTHVDSAVMGAGRFRTDVSVTVFLSDPSEYQGGDLQIGSPYERSFKLAAGSLLAYPSTTLHRVMPVFSGERLVAVFWVKSQVRNAAQREILADLDVVKRTLFERQGTTVEFDLLNSSYTNLLRMWAE